MNNAELKVVKFGESDVIATSVFTMSGLYDGTSGNISFGTAKNTNDFLSTYGSTTFYLHDVSNTCEGSGIANGEEESWVADFYGSYDYVTVDPNALIPDGHGDASGSGSTWGDYGFESGKYYYIHQ